MVYAFMGGTDAGEPQTALPAQGNGDLYGTTPEGGTAGYCGTVFCVSTSGSESVLYSFEGAFWMAHTRNRAS